MSDQLQASIATVTMKIDGTVMSLAERDLEEIVIDTSQNLPSMATIRLHDPKLKWAESTTFKIGARLELTMAPSRSMQKIEPKLVFDGEIVSLEPSFSALGTSIFMVRAYDKSHRLHIGTKTRTFLKMTDSDIVKKIAGEVGLSAGKVSSLKIKHEYIIQNNLTDFEFLSVRARRAGCILSVVANAVNFALPKDLQTVGPSFEMGESLREFSVRASGTQQNKTLLVRGWDPTTKKEIVARQQTPKTKWAQTSLPENGSTAGKVFGSGTLSLTTFAPGTQDEAQQIVDAAINDQEARYIEADGIAFGHPELVAGKLVDLKSLGEKYSGKYFVTSASHIYNSAGYEVHFTVAGRYQQTYNQLLAPAEGGEREPGSVMNVVVGLVTNNNDPNNWGRVKVKYPWLSDTEESNWARVATPSAGNNRGIFWLPEVNDEVLIAFEHGNMSHPYVLGALWNGKDKVPEGGNSAVAKGGTVNKRVMMSRTGHKVIMDDSAGAEGILIQDKTGNNLIKIDSVKNDIEIKANGNLTIDVKGKISIKAGMSITVNAGTNIDIQANTTMKVQATAQLEMKASTMALQSSGPLTQKGNPIMLN